MLRGALSEAFQNVLARCRVLNHAIGNVTSPGELSQKSLENVLIVDEVPNSGYMLRLTQEHECLRLSTTPVDMAEDRP